MDEPQVQVQDEAISPWSRHRFLILIGGTIVTSLILVTISLLIYKASGAAQLDLSRPGYRSVSSQTVNNDNGFANYSAEGPINQQSLNQFKTLYSQQAQTVTALDAFGGDPLDPNTLEFGTAPQSQ